MKRISLVAGVVLALIMAVPVFAHQATGIVGSVDCQGNYLIQVNADVWGGHHLIVTLGGSVISDVADNGSDQSTRLFSFTGTGGTIGEAITAYTDDQGAAKAVSSTLTGPEGGCVTITPSPSPSKSPTPTPTKTPRVTATPSLPATDTGNGSDPTNGTWPILVGAIAVAAVVVYGISRRLRE